MVDLKLEILGDLLRERCYCNANSLSIKFTLIYMKKNQWISVFFTRQ